jgi:O-antigen/teichoic acid export membrane protein
MSSLHWGEHFLRLPAEKVISKRFKNTYVVSLITLLSGTAIAQAIPILVSPVIARLYVPEDLGTLALFTSLTVILCVFATGRFELAIPVVRTEKEAFSILLGASCLTLLVACGLYPLIAIFLDDIVHLFGNERLSRWLWLVPVSVAATGWYQLLTYWSNRKRQYRDIAQSRVVQATMMGAGQTVAGAMKAGASGLIGGALLGQIAGLTRLAVLVGRHDRWRFNAGLPLRCKAALRRHRRFPVYMVPGQLANVASLQIAVILLSVCYGHAVAGYYALAERVIIAPSAIIGTAVGDVFRQHAAELYRKNGNCKDIYFKTSLLLIGIALTAFIALVISARWLFTVVFGPAWSASGEIATIMAVLMFFQIISSPLSQTVYLAKWEHIDMIWQFARLALSATAIMTGYWIWNDYRVSIALYVGAVSLMYLVHSIMQYKVASGSAVIAQKRYGQA